MAEPENIIPVYLRRLGEKLDALSIDIRELKDRATSSEMSVGALRRDLAQVVETDARLPAGLDRLRDDVTRIRLRLDIADAPAD
jgi:predicted nuclease with TOPRIM domain